MYTLGNQFNFNLSNSLSNPECVFAGKKYRITVLTERVIRLEYSESGTFLDKPTEFAWYRNFKKPLFNFTETNNTIQIVTKYFNLRYKKEKSFKGTKLNPTTNLSIQLNKSDKRWYYGHPEARKFKSVASNNKYNKKSLYSLDGFASIDDSEGLIVEENGTYIKRDTKEIDIYVFMYGNDFYYCLNDYFMITGKPQLLPRYALGNWWDKDEYYNDEDVTKLIKKFEVNNVPVSVIILNNWNKKEEYIFNENYKVPTETINYIKGKNIKLGLQLQDQLNFKQNTDAFNKLKSYIPQDSNGNIPFNLYDPRTIDAYLKLLIHPLNNYKVDLYSLEGINKKYMDRNNILKYYLYYDQFRTNQRPLISSYLSGVAPHRYSVLYSGKLEVSWEALNEIVPFYLSSFNIGASYLCSDVGGSTDGIEDGELFTRFVELGVFSPILRLGSENGKYYKREPWKWGLKPREIAIYYLNLRYKLIPYIYTELYKYHKYGKPLIEPLYFTHTSLIDSNLYKNEYLFGSTFLVCPVTEKKDILMNRVVKKLYIPEGIWFDFFTGQKYKGNKKYISFYRDEEYPVFVKAGAIVPLALNKFNDTSVPENMEIQIFPGASNTYSIYEDDGCSNDYLKEEYSITNIEYQYKKDNYVLTILPTSGKKGILPKTRNYKVRFKNTKPGVTISSYVAANQVSNTYYKEENDLVVVINDVPTNSQLTIIVKGTDIEYDALRIVSEDIVSIISDLPIKTKVKQKIDDILFSSKLDNNKKRIQIRKLSRGKDHIEEKYVNLLLKLLEYMNEL